MSLNANGEINLENEGASANEMEKRRVFHGKWFLISKLESINSSFMSEFMFLLIDSGLHLSNCVGLVLDGSPLRLDLYALSCDGLGFSEE